MPTVGWVTCRLDKLPKSCKTEKRVWALDTRLWDGGVCESNRVWEEHSLLQTRERLARCSSCTINDLATSTPWSLSIQVGGGAPMLNPDTNWTPSHKCWSCWKPKGSTKTQTHWCADRLIMVNLSFQHQLKPVWSGDQRENAIWITEWDELQTFQQLFRLSSTEDAALLFS